MVSKTTSSNDSKTGFRFVERFSEIPQSDWDELSGSELPFTSYAYLDSLEATGAATAESGWQPFHLTYRGADGDLQFAMPLYLRDNSWGEFVFDFAWADAFHRNGIPYYPKLTTAIPFTPVTGPRLLCKAGSSAPTIDQIITAVKAKAVQLNASSWHVLFTDKEEALRLNANELLTRKDCQFHWFNRDYANYDEFLATFKSSARKKTRRERKKISQAGVVIEHSKGSDLDDHLWQEFYALYASSFYKRGRAPYFKLEFFKRISQATPTDMRIVWGLLNDERIAAAMFFVTDDVLYGRYWGCKQFVDGLHFELCYHQGIELCIAKKIAKFDPGVQGEHKIARGFEAASSWSTHWIQHEQFADAIARYLDEESGHIDAYMKQVDQHTPFRKAQPES